MTVLFSRSVKAFDRNDRSLIVSIILMVLTLMIIIIIIIIIIIMTIIIIILIIIIIIYLDAIVALSNDDPNRGSVGM